MPSSTNAHNMHCLDSFLLACLLACRLAGLQVMEAVMLLLNENQKWENVKKVMGRSDFMARLIHFEKDKIPKATRKARSLITVWVGSGCSLLVRSSV